jgi:non-ribosomal peptide synthetase component F
LLTDSERQQLLHEFNDTAAEFPQDVCLHQLIEQQVARTPEQVALVFEQEQVSYRELNERANQLAHHLRSLGVKTESPVGILLERSVEMVVALLGVLKAGGAYVPLDPEYPAERLRFMLEDAQVAVLITQPRLAEMVPYSSTPLLMLEEAAERLGQHETSNPELLGGAENLAYIIYTSGSTGQPKGAMNTHRGIVNRLLWMQAAYGLNEQDRVLQKTPFSFDVSVWEFFWPLLTGARLVLARPGGHRDRALDAERVSGGRETGGMPHAAASDQQW